MFSNNFADEPEEKCTPGESRPAGDGCNYCTCYEGNYSTCTEMLCTPTITTKSPSPLGNLNLFSQNIKQHNVVTKQIIFY